VKRGFVNIRDIRLSYIDYGGTGPYLILLHGVMSRATNWYDIAMWLKERYHVSAMDQRGHGLSDKPDAGYSKEESVQDIIDFMNELGIDNAVLSVIQPGG